MKSKRICASCGTLGKIKAEARGSFAVECVVWVVAVGLTISAPALAPLCALAAAYSLWRFFAPYDVRCAACGSKELIPVDSPRGRALTASLGDGEKAA